MPDEPTTGGQAEATTPDVSGQSDAAAPTMIEVNGQNLTIEQAKANFEAGQREMREKQQLAADQGRELDGYRQWADPIRDRYNQDSAYKESFDALYAEQAAQAAQQPQQQHTLSPDYQRQMQLEAQVHRLTIEGDISKLKGEGLNLDKDMEVKLLQHMHTNSLHDTEAAYWKLFGRDAVHAARGDATRETAEHIARNSDSYDAPKGGSVQKGPKVDVSKLSPKEFEEATIERIAKDLF